MMYSHSRYSFIVWHGNVATARLQPGHCFEDSATAFPAVCVSACMAVSPAGWLRCHITVPMALTVAACTCCNCMPGMLLPQQLLSARLPGSTAGRGAGAAGDAGKPTRTTARCVTRAVP
jgi:hypothetical protein